MKTKTISRLDAVEFIRRSNGRIMSLEFVKRSDGSLRQMVCRTGVTAHLKGGEPAYSFAKHNLISVYDMEISGYRVVNIDGLTRIKVQGAWREVTDDEGTTSGRVGGNEKHLTRP